MRGKDCVNDLLIICRWITPAYAGKSFSQRKGSIMEKDHPRVCGEKKQMLH